MGHYITVYSLSLWRWFSFYRNKLRLVCRNGLVFFHAYIHAQHTHTYIYMHRYWCTYLWVYIYIYTVHSCTYVYTNRYLYHCLYLSMMAATCNFSQSPGSWQEVCWRTATSSVPTRALKHRWGIPGEPGQLEVGATNWVFQMAIEIVDFPMNSMVIFPWVFCMFTRGFFCRSRLWWRFLCFRLFLNDPSNLVGQSGHRTNPANSLSQVDGGWDYQIDPFLIF
jgi:hypothetical protein